MRLNTVVFPDPFGPMSPVTLPSSTANEQSSTAVTPPNRLHKPGDPEERNHYRATASGKRAP